MCWPLRRLVLVPGCWVEQKCYALARNMNEHLNGHQQPEAEPPESAEAAAPKGLRLPGGVALRLRDFRFFWFGYVIEVSGQQMLFLAQSWLIYELSGSAYYLGAAGLARAIP